MVDTLVLGTSAKAWEFESLHAHITKEVPFGTSFVIWKSSSEKCILLSSLVGSEIL